MCDVLIVNPPSPDGHIYIRDACRWGRKSRERMIWPQTTLAYLAAMVPQGMSVRIIDAIAEEMSEDSFFAEIDRENPRFYVSYIAGTTFDVDARGIAHAKARGAMTVALGTHPSAVPKDTLERVPELDLVLRHEPEITFREVLERAGSGVLMQGCLGIAFRAADGTICISPDRPLLKNMDELPIPLQHLLPLDRYNMPFLGSRYTWVLTNRGCPHSCTYCFESLVWGKSVRSRSAASIVRELEYLASHNVRNVLFLADLFTHDRGAVLELCDLIIARSLKVRWVCNSRVDCVDEQMLRRMKAAGCWLIAFGIESGSQLVLDAVKKNAKVEDARAAVELCCKVGIRTWGYFIMGLPGETSQSLGETARFARSLPLDIALFHIAVPYAGTEFYFQAVANGWLNTVDWKHFDMNDSVVVQYPGLPAQEILAATKRAFREFYFRPTQMLRLARMLLGTGDVGMVLRVGRNFVSWIFSSGDGDRAAQGPPMDSVEVDRPVLESPRSDPATAKPRHHSVRGIAAAQTSADKDS